MEIQPGHLRALQTSSEQTLEVMLRKGFVKFAAQQMNTLCVLWKKIHGIFMTLAGGC